MKFILIFITTLFILSPSEALSFPDLMEIKHISSKGRVQDKEYHPNIPIIDELIKNGKLSIPFLIEQLKSKKAYGLGVLDLWPYVEERHVALIILTDLFLNSTWDKSCAPDFCYDSLLSADKYSSDLAIWDIFRDHFGPKDWDLLIMKWNSFWDMYKDKIYWDSKERFFRIEGKQLKPCK